MKLPKPLLAALLAGITLSAVQSCTKDKDEPPKDEKKDEGDKPKPPVPLYNCPACGMG